MAPAGSDTVVSARWFGFRLPFVACFTTNHAHQHCREGVLLRVVFGDGSEGWGEAAPVAGFVPGSIDDVRREVAALAGALPGMSLAEAETLLLGFDTNKAGGGVAASALDCALAVRNARVARLPLSRMLIEQPRSDVLVNATIGASDLAGAEASARQARDEGFGCAKLKVGTAPTTEAELARIAAVREALGPDIGLRLDANGAWQVGQAITILRAAEPLGIELVEQPVGAANLDGMAQVRRLVHIPVAADEAAIGLRDVQAVIAAGAADVIMVKPMLAGGPRRAATLIAQVQRAGLQPIVTTTIDSGIGTAMAIHVAATLAAPAPACGLATAALLEHTLTVEHLRPQAGRIVVPAGAGLGVQIDFARLAHYGAV